MAVPSENYTQDSEQAEVQEFLHPLSLRGWRGGDGQASTPRLCGELASKNARKTRKAAKDIIKLMEEKNHDISWGVNLKARPVLQA